MPRVAINSGGLMERIIDSEPLESPRQILTSMVADTEGIEDPQALLTSMLLEGKEAAIEEATEILKIQSDPRTRELMERWPLAESVGEAEHIQLLWNDPVQFWNNVKGAWDAAKTAEEKNAYSELIRKWVSKHIHEYIVPSLNPNYYGEMLNALGIPLMGWVTGNILTDAIGHFWRMWFTLEPAAFIQTVLAHAETLPTPETRADYVNTIRENTAWYINDLAAAGTLFPLLDLLPIDPLVFATFELWPEHVHYGNWQWLIKDPAGWIKKEIEVHKTIPVEDVDAVFAHREAVKDMIKSANFPADFIKSKIPPSIRVDFIKTFYPELAEQVKDEGIDGAQVAKVLGWGALGIFGIFLVSKVVGGKGGGKTFFIPAPSK